MGKNANTVTQRYCERMKKYYFKRLSNTNPDLKAEDFDAATVEKFTTAEFEDLLCYCVEPSTANDKAKKKAYKKWVTEYYKNAFGRDGATNYLKLIDDRWKKVRSPYLLILSFHIEMQIHV